MGWSWFVLYNFKIFCTQSTLPRFLLVWTVNFWNQTLIYDNDISKRLSKICKSSYEHAMSLGILVMRSHPKYIFSALDSTWSFCGKARALNNKHPLIEGVLPKMVFFVVVACTCSFVTGDDVTGSARQLDSLLVQQSLRAWRMVQVSRWLCFLFGCCLQVVVVVCVLGCTD